MSTHIADRFTAEEIMLTVCGTICPCCEKRKLRGCCFCDACYEKLSPDVKRTIKNGLRVMSEALRNGLLEIG